ncbi:hypothetical protein BLA29_003942 [Euroglyphus maynei]|uniref:Peptidase M16C associated domain-containing protein n=1 Tax=Euroglyphus maynei TaxID=6958 RepID=A0A1Y3AXA0_EURMA|nr:hypothetical protein BLA29_003942 [Euroglyphus maynei]
MDSYTEGFPQERIDAILHRIELGTKHQGSNFGLGLLTFINSYWNHDVDPIECLNINKQVEQFKENLRSDPKYLQKKVKQYFIDNKHRLVIEMSPDLDYENQQQKLEKDLLDSKISKLSTEDLEEIYKNGAELLKVQNTQEDLSVLPTLNIQDISRTIMETNLENIRMGSAGVPVQYSAQPTNGIVYFNSVIELKPEMFPKKLVPYLPLFAQVMTKLGAGQMDRKQLDQKIQMHTGGLASMVHIADHPASFDRFETGLYLNSHCLERNLEEMFRLWTEIFTGRSVYCVPYSHVDHAKLRIASSLMSMKFLHKEIREKGGAYGGGSRFDSGGMFHLYSYRDPQISSTINAFERVGEWLIRPKNYQDEEIDEAKLQVFQSVDQPIPPGEQGMEQFLTGITDQMRQEYRYRLLDVTREDIQEVAERYLLNVDYII